MRGVLNSLGLVHRSADHAAAYLHVDKDWKDWAAVRAEAAGRSGHCLTYSSVYYLFAIAIEPAARPTLSAVVIYKGRVDSIRSSSVFFALFLLLRFITETQSLSLNPAVAER